MHTARLHALGQIIDHLVDALGEPSCPVRRALVLNDLWSHPGSSLNDVMERLSLDKSTAFRDIDWLVDHGCVVKKTNLDDAREVHLQVVGHAKQHLEMALHLTGSPANLAEILTNYMNLSHDGKQTLRETKILISLTKEGGMDKNSLTKSLYNGPTSTDQRAVQNLINEGLIKEDGR